MDAVSCETTMLALGQQSYLTFMHMVQCMGLSLEAFQAGSICFGFFQVGNRRRIAPEPVEPGPSSVNLQPSAVARNPLSLYPRPPKPPASLPDAPGLPAGANQLFCAV